MELYVQYREQCTNSHRELEAYGSWEEHYDFSVTGVSATSRDTWEEETFAVAFDSEPGTPVFVLSIVYDTGDSFGRAHGKGEVMWVFKDAALANRARQAWKAATEREEFSVEFEVEDGRKIKIHNPAAGYFERLVSVDVESFLINP